MLKKVKFFILAYGQAGSKDPVVEFRAPQGQGLHTLGREVGGNIIHIILIFFIDFHFVDLYEIRGIQIASPSGD